ncbi:MAG TPA: cytochrome P450 [Solirubrobacteraceae bacterium]|nr:cytochrome P450 [Solirubrobacteraceae bacterium]
MSTKLRSRSTARAALPPGPRMPGALQGVGWARRPLSFMERCQRRYGDTFTLRIRHGGTWVLLCDPEDVKRVFTADPELLGVGEANTLLGPVLGPRSVMLLEEPAHMTRRRLMLPPFHGRRMEGYGDAVVEATRRELASWPVAAPFELWPRMQAITLEVVMRVVFGPVETAPLKRLRGLLRELTERMNDPRRLSMLALLGPRSMVGNVEFQTAMGRVEAAVLEEVRRRRAEPDSAERDDVVSMLAHARYEDGSPMTAQDLRDELITLVLDGPTSTSLAWVFERLLRHPDKLARLREELRAGADDAYLQAVLRETLRLCPPVPIVVRRLLAPMRLGGYTIPAGAMVAPCIHLLHRREDVYPQPRSFVPERFLDRPPGTYTWIPFGGGVRRCLAASFALLEMKHVVQTVLGEVELRPVESRSEQVARSAISFSPGRRGLVTVVRRTPGISRTPTLAGGARGATCLPAP